MFTLRVKYSDEPTALVHLTEGNYIIADRALRTVTYNDQHGETVVIAGAKVQVINSAGKLVDSWDMLD